jgi:hypothetical protein
LYDPLSVTLSCIDSCSGDGATRCANDAVEICATDVFGCLAWQVLNDCAAAGDVCDDFSGTPVCAPCASFCGTAGETRCNADVIETCTDVGQGCLDYVGGTDCALTGEVCLDAAGAAACVVPAGEDCADPWVLNAGLNEVAWSSVVNDYTTATPSCGSGSSPTGPDVVLSYTATSSGVGYLDVTMEKQPSTRHHIVVSSGACGSLTPQVACISDFTNPAMGATFQVTGGTTYWFYVVDSTSGTNPLPNPFTLTLDELDCAIFSATPGNEMPPNGGTSTTLRPQMSVDFDAPIDPSTGIIQVVGDLGTNLVYDLAANPAQISLTNGDRTMLIEPGFFFPVGEQVSVTWFGLQDALCGGPVATPVWTFIIPTPTCVPGAGGMVGTTQTRTPTTIPTSFTEYYVVPDDDPAGFVYVGGTSALYRMPKVGGVVDDVAALAGLTSTELGYTMVIDGQSIFVINNVESQSGVLFRISSDGGVTWNVTDFATFPVAPRDWIRGATVHGGRLYMLTQEVSTGVDTEIWSVAVNPASIPDTAVFETAVPERGCSAIAMDNVNFYLACSTGDRVVRVDRTTAQTTLLTAGYDVASIVNTVHAHDVGGDGIADVLYLQTGREEAYYFCDPAVTPFTDLMLTWGAGTDNFGLGFDDATSSLWAYDDDVEELILIE